MDLLIPGRKRMTGRWLPLLPFLALLLAVHPASLPAQPRLPLSLAEVREIQTIRELRQAGDAEALVQAADSYLEKFPNGRYRDETLMALAEGHTRRDAPREALAAYGRVIEELADSPFREEAMVASVPLLQEVGEAERAQALSAEVLAQFPRSLFRGRTLLWQAGQAYRRKAFQEALALLAKVDPEEGLRGADKTEYFRLAGWVRHEAGEPGKALPFFARYLEFDDSAERKAPVLMAMAKAYADSGEHGKALAAYDQVAERHPDPSFLHEALYRRAELFAGKMLAGMPEEQQAEALARAIAYYDTYLPSGDARHLEPALKARAGLLARSGRKQEALRDYERLAERSEAHARNPEMLVARAGLLADLERGTEGIALLSRAIGNTALPQQVRTTLVVERAALHYRLEDCAGTLAGLKPLPVFSDGEQRRRAFFLRGFCRFRLGEWEQASWDLEVLVNEAEYAQSVWPALAEAYERSGQFSRLVNTGERLLEAGGVEPSEALFLRLGKGYEELGQPAMMLSAFQRLGERNPDALLNPEVQFRMGRAEEALGNVEAAEAHYLAVLAAWEEGAAVPPTHYLDALERMQGVYLRRAGYEPLIALNRRARGRFAEGAETARIAGWQAMAHLRWGEAEARTGNEVEAGKHYVAAWEALPEREGDERFEVLEALARHHAANNGHERARELFGAELKRAKDESYRARVATAFGMFYLAWGRSTEDKAEPGKVTRRYEEALRLLPRKDWRARYDATVRLDGLYAKKGAFRRRAEMFEGLTKIVPDEDLRDKLRLYRSRIHGDWSRHELARNAYAAALAQNAKGVKLLKKKEWKLRYELLSGKGEILLKQGNYSELMIEYERFLPEIPEEALRGQVHHFLGQAYLTWAQQAKREKNVKSTRIRSHRALDYLPGSDWERRLAATRLLADALEVEKKPEQAAAMYAALIPQLPEGKVRGQYALFLGRQYAERLKQPDEARKWLGAADRGGNDDVSVEAVYRLAELEWSSKKPKEALALLEGLTPRGLETSKWHVPIYSRLAVIYHERNDLKRALAHYRVVANVKSKEQRKLYPRSITLAREQVRAIEGYLKFRGGRAGGRVAVPKIRR
jgi:tetratricopeptide (TPR) repeat protein